MLCWRCSRALLPNLLAACCSLLDARSVGSASASRDAGHSRLHVDAEALHAAAAGVRPLQRPAGGGTRNAPG